MRTAFFQALMDANPDYCATYFHAGQTLERIGRAEEARAAYEKGIEVTAAPFATPSR